MKTFLGATDLGSFHPLLLYKISDEKSSFNIKHSFSLSEDNLAYLEHVSVTFTVENLTIMCRAEYPNLTISTKSSVCFCT